MPSQAWLLLGGLVVAALLFVLFIVQRLRPPPPRRHSAWPGVFRQLLLAAPIRLWAVILGGPPLLAYAAWVTNIVWRGPWGPDHQAQQLDIIGWALWGALGLVAVVVVSLACVKVSAETKLGNFRIEGDDDHRPTP